MNIEDAAAKLHGNEYRREGSTDLWREMREHRLVAVFGASDDLTELRGAINEEMGSAAFAVGHDGLMFSECEEGDDCPYYKRLVKGAPTIEPQWDAGTGYSWTYKTSIPHATFDIVEDGETYCRGIVFSLDRLAA